MIFAYLNACFFIRTSAGEEGLHNLNLAQSCAPATKRTLLKQSRQRSIGRTRLHLALSSLKGQPTERNVSIEKVSSILAFRWRDREKINCL